jgi:hypothetical protein
VCCEWRDALEGVSGGGLWAAVYQRLVGDAPVPPPDEKLPWRLWLREALRAQRFLCHQEFRPTPGRL